MKKEKIIEKIGKLICDKTAGILVRKKQLQDDGEEFGSLVTLTYLQRKIFPLLDELQNER